MNPDLTSYGTSLDVSASPKKINKRKEIQQTSNFNQIANVYYYIYGIIENKIPPPPPPFSLPQTDGGCNFVYIKLILKFV
jgi:hypothetical protein